MSYDRRYQPYRSNSARRDYAAAPVAGFPLNFDQPRWQAYKAVQPVRAEWVERKAATFEFAAKMFDAVLRFGDLTEGQNGAVDRCVERDLQWAAQRATNAPQAASASFPRIVAAFAEVAAGGGRKPVTIGDVTLSMAGAQSANPGCVYVKVAGVYCGKITPEGGFRPGRDAPADLVAKLVVIEADVQGAVRAHAARIAAQLAAAQAAGQPLSLPCGCCGITLTDPVSVARGIGPICAGRWGF